MTKNKTVYDGEVFSQEELELLDTASKERYKKLLNRNRDFIKERLAKDHFEQLIKDVIVIANAIDDNDKCLDILSEDIISYSGDNISREIARKIAEGLIENLTSTAKDSYIAMWYEKKIINFYIIVLNNIIIRRNRIIDHECFWPRCVEDFKDIDELINKLNLLIKSLDLIINNKEEYNITLGKNSLPLRISDEIKAKVVFVKKQLEVDIVTLPEYTKGAKAEDEKNEQLMEQYDIEMAKYLEAKAQYNSRSKLEKIWARLNGKEAEPALKKPDVPKTKSYYYGATLGGIPMYDIEKRFGRSQFSEQELFGIEKFWNRLNQGSATEPSNIEKDDRYLIWSFSNPTHYYEVYEQIKKGKNSR